MGLLAAACSRSVPGGAAMPAPARPAAEADPGEETRGRRRRSSFHVRHERAAGPDLAAFTDVSRAPCARRPDFRSRAPRRPAARLLRARRSRGVGARRRPGAGAGLLARRRGHARERCRPTAPSRTPAARPGWRGCARRASTCRVLRLRPRQPGQLRGVVAAVEPRRRARATASASRSAPASFSATVPTLGALLDAQGLKWRGLQRGMTGAPGGHDCLHAPSRRRRLTMGGHQRLRGRATTRAVVRQVLDHGRQRGLLPGRTRSTSASCGRTRASASSLPAGSFRRARHLQRRPRHGHDRRVHAGSRGPGAPSGVAADRRVAAGVRQAPARLAGLDTTACS